MKPKTRNEIPAELLNDYTMGSKIEIDDLYFDDSCSEPRIYEKEQINSFIEKIKNKEIFYYRNTDKWLYQALEKYPIENKKVVIMGSNVPLYESFCLHYGGECTTIEYNKIISKHPSLKIMTPDEYDKNPTRFDVGFSISSFEHSGLGRYGDTLNPNGDLDAMKKMKSILKPGGILFLAVPVGKDKVVWNAHRVYGKIRLPLLLKGWEVLDYFGYDEKLLDKNNWGKIHQPVFVLKNVSKISFTKFIGEKNG